MASSHTRPRSSHPSFTAVETDSVRHLICGICLEPWDAPRELLPCGHIFCAACAENVDSCPECRAHIEERCAPNRALVNMADDATLRCEECGWIGTRAASRHHSQDCSRSDQRRSQAARAPSPEFAARAEDRSERRGVRRETLEILSRRHAVLATLLRFIYLTSDRLSGTRGAANTTNAIALRAQASLLFALDAARLLRDAGGVDFAVRLAYRALPALRFTTGFAWGVLEWTVRRVAGRDSRLADVCATAAVLGLVFGPIVSFVLSAVVLAGVWFVRVAWEAVMATCHPEVTWDGDRCYVRLAGRPEQHRLSVAVTEASQPELFAFLDSLHGRLTAAAGAASLARTFTRRGASSNDSVVLLSVGAVRVARLGDAFVSTAMGQRLDSEALHVLTTSDVRLRANTPLWEAAARGPVPFAEAYGPYQLFVRCDSQQRVVPLRWRVAPGDPLHADLEAALHSARPSAFRRTTTRLMRMFSGSPGGSPGGGDAASEDVPLVTYYGVQFFVENDDLGASSRVFRRVATEDVD